MCNNFLFKLFSYKIMSLGVYYLLLVIEIVLKNLVCLIIQKIGSSEHVERLNANIDGYESIQMIL